RERHVWEAERARKPVGATLEARRSEGGGSSRVDAGAKRGDGDRDAGDTEGRRGVCAAGGEPAAGEAGAYGGGRRGESSGERGEYERKGGGVGRGGKSVAGRRGGGGDSERERR